MHYAARQNLFREKPQKVLRIEIYFWELMVLRVVIARHQGGENALNFAHGNRSRAFNNYYATGCSR
jgi:hypothetical protein